MKTLGKAFFCCILLVVIFIPTAASAENLKLTPYVPAPSFSSESGVLSLPSVFIDGVPHNSSIKLNPNGTFTLETLSVINCAVNGGAGFSPETPACVGK